MKKKSLLVVAACAALLATSAQAQFQWAKRIASTVNPDDELAIGMAIDSSTNLYVAGWFDGTNDFGGVTLTNKPGGGQDIFFGKYNSAGTLQWARRAGGNTTKRDEARGIGVDSAGNVYVTGGFSGTADFDSTNLTASQDKAFFIAKYNSAGTVQWVRQNVGGGAYDWAYGTGLAVDGNGNSYAIGYYDGSGVTFGGTTLTNPGDYNTFLVKYDSAGTLQWAKSVAASGFVYSTKVVLDSASNVCLEGTFTGTITVGSTNLVSAGGRDVFVAKFNSAGVLQWARQAGGTGDEMSDGGIAADAANNVFISGGFNSGTISFGSTTLTNEGAFNAFVAKYDSAGTFQWARRSGGSGLDLFTSATTDQQGNVYVAGGTSTNTNFGISAGWDVTMTEYDANGNVKWVQTAGGTNNELPWNILLDPAGNVYFDGWFQGGAATFGTNTLQSQGYFNFFLTKLPAGAALESVPFITGQPVSRTNWTGSAAIFTVSAVGGSPLSYQWRKNGTNLVNGGNISGVTTTNLTITNVQTNDAGNFTVVVTNTYGSVTSSVAVLTVEVPPYTYTTNNGAITITGYTGTNATVIIPGTINGLPVTSIGDWAFNYCTGLTGITIPSSITSIGSYAFYYCYGLTGNLTIPSSVTNIGDYAFYCCTRLTDLTIPVGVTTIGNSAFDRCYGLTGNLTIPVGVTTIGDGAFAYCSGLTGNLTIPAGVTNIGSSAFYGCSGLTGNLTIPTSVTSISANTFFGCSNLTGSITIPAGVTTIGGSAFYYCTGLTGNLTIPSSVTTIGGAAFYYCTGLTGNLAIPSSVTNIGDSAFYYCTGLTGNLTIPAGVTYIGSYAFYNCYGLTGDLTIPAGITYIGDYAFYYCTRLTGTLTIPAGVTIIGSYAFYHCSNLTGSLIIPAGVTSIGDYAFHGCSGLTGNLIIPAGVASIRNYAFYGCGLTGLTISSRVTSIGNYAFYGCSKLTGNLTIPAGVTIIGKGAFYSCSNLTGVYFNGNAPGLGDTSVFSYDNNMTIYRLAGATGWPAVPNLWAGRPTALWDPASDVDADGIPASWELQYFGGTTNANPNAICSNGINTVRQAYIAGLNPNDPQSKLLISDFRSSNAGKVLGWNTVSGRVYSVYWTTNLLSGFQPLATNLPWTCGNFTNQTAVPRGYYKIDVRLE